MRKASILSNTICLIILLFHGGTALEGLRQSNENNRESSKSDHFFDLSSWSEDEKQELRELTRMIHQSKDSLLKKDKDETQFIQKEKESETSIQQIINYDTPPQRKLNGSKKSKGGTSGKKQNGDVGSKRSQVAQSYSTNFYSSSNVNPQPYSQQNGGESHEITSSSKKRRKQSKKMSSSTGTGTATARHGGGGGSGSKSSKSSKKGGSSKGSESWKSSVCREVVGAGAGSSSSKKSSKKGGESYYYEEDEYNEIEEDDVYTSLTLNQYIPQEDNDANYDNQENYYDHYEYEDDENEYYYYYYDRNLHDVDDYNDPNENDMFYYDDDMYLTLYDWCTDNSNPTKPVCPNPESTVVPCAPDYLPQICDKYNGGDFLSCYTECKPSYCCIHDSTSKINAPSCSTEANCDQYRFCYVIWWKLADTIGPAIYLRPEQDDTFFENAADVVDDINSDAAFNLQLFGHFFNTDDDLSAETFDNPENWLRNG